MKLATMRDVGPTPSIAHMEPPMVCKASTIKRAGALISDGDSGDRQSNSSLGSGSHSYGEADGVGRRVRGEPPAKKHKPNKILGAGQSHLPGNYAGPNMTAAGAATSTANPPTSSPPLAGGDGGTAKGQHHHKPIFSNGSRAGTRTSDDHADHANGKQQQRQQHQNQQQQQHQHQHQQQQLPVSNGPATVVS